MISPILVLSAIVVCGFLVVLNVLLLVYFQHDDDKNEAHFAKTVAVLGLTLAEVSVMMLPFDIAVSSYGDVHREHMEILWQVLYMILAFVLIVLIPVALYYYESEDPEDNKPKLAQCMRALQMEACTVLTSVLTLVILYFFLGDAFVPYWKIQSTFEPVGGAALAPIPLSPIPFSPSTKDLFEIDVTFPVFTMAFISFFGWFFFVMFASVGLVALPFDLLAEYINRPRKLSLEAFVTKKEEICRQAKELKDLGDVLVKEKRAKSKDQRILNRYKKAVYFLERDWVRIQHAYNDGGNPLLYFAYLLAGILTAILSLLWLLHIILFMFLDPEDVHPFLNNLFLALDGSFPFLGTVFYGVFSFYLVWATIKGCTKLGLRIVFFTVHPMKLGATMMNSFLFNVALILLCSVPVVQFCATAFALYAHDSAIENLFTIQATNLKGIRHLYINNVFLYSIFVVSGLTFLWLLVWPNDQPRTLTGGEENDDDD